MKNIIDKHYTDNYKYYKVICKRYINNITHEDMLHELYLKFFKVNEAVIIEYNKLNKLTNIGCMILRYLAQNRYRTKKNKQGETSPLFISNVPCDINDIYSLNNDEVNSLDYIIDLIESKQTEENKEELFSKLNHAIIKNLNNENNTYISVFLQANETSLYELHKDSGISRFYLKRSYDKGKEILKKELNE